MTESLQDGLLPPARLARPCRHQKRAGAAWHAHDSPRTPTKWGRTQHFKVGWEFLPGGHLPLCDGVSDRRRPFPPYHTTPLPRFGLPREPGRPKRTLNAGQASSPAGCVGSNTSEVSGWSSNSVQNIRIFIPACAATELGLRRILLSSLNIFFSSALFTPIRYLTDSTGPTRGESSESIFEECLQQATQSGTLFVRFYGYAFSGVGILRCISEGTREVSSPSITSGASSSFSSHFGGQHLCYRLGRALLHFICFVWSIGAQDGRMVRSSERACWNEDIGQSVLPPIICRELLFYQGKEEVLRTWHASTYPARDLWQHMYYIVANRGRLTGKATHVDWIPSIINITQATQVLWSNNRNLARQ